MLDLFDQERGKWLSQMTGLNLYWLAVLQFSVGCYSALLIVMKIVRIKLRKRGDIELGIKALKSIIYIMSRENTRRRLTNAFVFTAGIIIGCWTMQLRMFSHIYTYEDMIIRSHYDPYRYEVQFFYQGDPALVGKLFELKLCPDTVVDWDDNSLVKTITFEDRGWCKSIANKHTGYTFYRMPNGLPQKKEIAHDETKSETGTQGPGKSASTSAR